MILSDEKQFDLHLIVDEIFANTTFPTTRNPSPIPFISVLSLDVWDASSQLLNQIHVLAGPTKDFGCSALKAGLLVTENAAVRQSVATALQATPISGAADAMLSALLIDEARTKALLEKNRAAQGRSFDLCADWAHVHGLPYVPMQLSAPAGTDADTDTFRRTQAYISSWTFHRSCCDSGLVKEITRQLSSCAA
jgi:aspartate/methionine/tyrosine aminotransferase